MKIRLLLIIISLLVCFSSYSKEDFFFDKNITIKEIAQKNKIAPFKLLHELNDDLEIKVAKGTSKVKDIGLTKAQFKKLYLHLHEELTPLIISGLILWITMGFLTFYWLKKRNLLRIKESFFLQFL